MCLAIIILCSFSAQQVLTDFYDDFREKMEANVVIMGLQDRNIIADGDVKTIFSYTDQKLQNEILHRVLKKKCTDEAFKVACDVIIKADPTNAVMVQLAEDMKRSLESYTGKWCICAHDIYRGLLSRNTTVTSLKG